MQTDINDMKVEKSVGMHSHAFERPCKHQIVTDTKSRNASQMFLWLIVLSLQIIISDSVKNYVYKIFTR